MITLFPELGRLHARHSILGRACRRGLVDLDWVDPRRWAGGRHRKLDARPYGGGPGMVMAAPPLARCLDAVLARRPGTRLLITDPTGRLLTQDWVEDLASAGDLTIICGHYEGIDHRICMLYRPEAFSLGRYILTGGELAALTLLDAVARLIPGVLGDARSAVEESFRGGDTDILDAPCYTAPRSFRGLDVPLDLLSGDHSRIAAWRAAAGRRPTPG